MPSLRTLVVCIVAAALGIAGWAAYQSYQTSKLRPEVQVAVFFPGPNEHTWSDFVEGVRLAAAEVGLTIQERPETSECAVDCSPIAVVFHWYPEVGARRIQRRVAELCRRSERPIAFVGSSNSELTRCLGSEIRRSADKGSAPALLMTSATADDLISLVPSRTFRFGFNNSTQAKAVVARLRDFVDGRHAAKSQCKAIVLRVADDEFSVDLAAHLAHELAETIQAQLVAPTARFQGSLIAGEKAVASDDKIWTLGTATGRYDDPSPAEWELARRILEKVIVDLESQWVVALPAGTSVYRRLTYAVSSVLKEMDDRTVADGVRNQLILISGDSLDYYGFRECSLNQLSPEESPGPVIFFSHANPLDRSVAPPPNRHIPARSLNREVARALIAVMPSLGKSPTPAGLAAALSNYTPIAHGEPMFENGERRKGGSAIVAVPRPAKQDFELLLPVEWRKGA